MDQICDKTDNECKCNSKHCFSVNLNEIQRDFKRFKVDESEKESTNGPKNDNSINSNYFSLKLSPFSPKMSCHEKRSTINGIRRQRPHSLSSIKVKTNALSTTKSRSTEEEDTECAPKDDSIDRDLSSCDECQQNGKHLYFNKDFKIDSNEWRNHFVDNNHKKCPNVDNNHKKCTNVDNKTTKVKSIRSRKMKFKDNTCARQALCDPTVPSGDATVQELAAYLDDTLYLPRKMSFMAEMMYT